MITPILGFYGALNPDPHDSSNFNWVAAVWTIGLIVVALVWFAIVLVLRRENVDERGLARRRAQGRGAARRDDRLRGGGRHDAALVGVR